MVKVYREWVIGSCPFFGEARWPEFQTILTFWKCLLDKIIVSRLHSVVMFTKELQLLSF